MMETPICDFVRRYAQSDTLRLHMPGHKGVPLLGVEPTDITEIFGADSLYEAQGIIRQSEENASTLFGCPTFYSTEGSSQCIRAMLLLVAQNRAVAGRRLRLLAGRNAHKAFLSACALLDADVCWLKGEYLSCRVTAQEMEKVLCREKPDAVYLTSPDYLGNTVDVAAIGAVCRRHGVLLLVDNAHGAYLRFLRPSRHPMDLGADLCCDSAHKTLPALTGGAYLHLSNNLPDAYAAGAKNALAMFGSTSPSYLILQSLDRVNAALADGFAEKLEKCSLWAARIREKLEQRGYALIGDEPMKLTLAPKSYGYTGTELAQHLRGRGIECEFADPDYLVLMLGAQMDEGEAMQMTDALLSLPKRPPMSQMPPQLPDLEQVISVRQAALSARQTIPVGQCIGRVLADASVGCPPAVPIAVCGQRLSPAAIACFDYYGITHCTVVRFPEEP